MAYCFSFCCFATDASSASVGQPNSSMTSSKDGNSTLPESGDINPDAVQVASDGVVLMDADSGKILFSKNAYQQMYPASITKIITALLVLDNCEMTDTATVSYYAIHSVPATYSIANLIPGETFTIKDLLYTLMIGSANDSAFVLAQYVANGGNSYPTDSSQDAKNKFNEDIEKFSNMMNVKAKELGCTSSNFVNPNGIHNENHYTTPYDLSLIAKFAYQNMNLMSIVNVMSYSLPNSDLYTGEVRTCNCTNSLLYSGRNAYYQYANGMKTGYTDPAGYCIVATASKDDVDLIAVVLHAQESSYSTSADQFDITRESDCIKLFNYGFENYVYTNLITSGDVAKTVSIINGDSDTKSLDLKAKEDIKALILKGEVIDVTPKITMTKSLAPIAEGEVVGTITYQYNGYTLSTDLIASHDVKSSDFANFFIRLFVVFIILLLIVIIMNKREKRRRKKKKKNYKVKK